MEIPAGLWITLILVGALLFIGLMGVVLTMRSDHRLLRELQGLRERVEEVHQKTESLTYFPELHARLDHAREELTRLSENLKSVHGFLSDTVHQQVTRQIEETLKSLARLEEKLRSASEDQIARIEEELHRISAILLGRRGGTAAEHVVDELLSVFPEGWVKRNVHLGDGEVEFAVVLPGGYLVPLDSKFVGAENMVRQDPVADPNDLKRKIKEQAQKIVKYLNDSRVPGFGIAAVPDSIYALCRSGIGEIADRHRIVVVPYSLLVPFVLSLYLIAQRLGLSVRQTETQQHIGLTLGALREASKALENMQREIQAVANQRERALRALGKAENALRLLSVEGSDGLPEVEGAQEET
jgi:DNA anti-recombination protein RmuC